MKLKVGDKIRITGVPTIYSRRGWHCHKETCHVWKKLAARKRAVRIANIDAYGTPWYHIRFQMKNGRWKWHSLSVRDGENNWVLVNVRKK